MFPLHIEDLLRSQISVEFRTKGHDQRNRRQTAAHKAISGYGGNVGSLSAQAYGEEIKLRAELIAESFQTVLERVRLAPYPALTDDLLALYNAEYQAVVAEWRPRIANAWNEGQSGTLGREPIDIEANLETWRIGPEMDVRLLAASIMEPISTDGQTIHITGSQVGVLQTGSGIVSVQTIALSQPEAAKLHEALAMISKTLSETPGVDPAKTAEVQEVIVDAQIALASPTPNLTKIKGLLVTVATSVKDVAAVATAYKIISTFLNAHGYHLP